MQCQQNFKDSLASQLTSITANNDKALKNYIKNAWINERMKNKEEKMKKGEIKKEGYRGEKEK